MGNLYFTSMIPNVLGSFPTSGFFFGPYEWFFDNKNCFTFLKSYVIYGQFILFSKKNLWNNSLPTVNTEQTLKTEQILRLVGKLVWIVSCWMTIQKGLGSGEKQQLFSHSFSCLSILSANCTLNSIQKPPIEVQTFQT